MDLTDNQTRLHDTLPTTDKDSATPAALAESTGLGYSTVTRLLRELAAAGLAVKDATGWRHPATPTGDPEPTPTHIGKGGGAVADDTGTPDREAPGEPANDAPDSTGPTPYSDGAEPDDAADAPGPRLRKGALREQVLDALRAADEPLGPTELSKRLGGRSQGAIANACDALVNTGHAVLANEKPRRFAATPVT